jgi:2-C-methyl-D-erythritol 4-phosphate cytidylyltransferase/2-C-methyl-D-erythritol 2,4-cyclodiphosphate synthase
VELALSVRDAGVEEIVLVLPRGYEIEENRDWALPVKVTSGGPTRTDSVRNGLRASTRDYVMVHDAARPFAGAKLLRTLMEHTTPTVGVIPVLPVTESIKRIDASGKVYAVDRDGLYATQTPQSFFRQALLEVLNDPSLSFKDEAEAWLAAGKELLCLQGGRLNFKVTWPEDLELAEALAAKRGLVGCEMTQNEVTVRTGIGYDVHRLVPERPLILGGVAVPSPLGLLGHSDADVLAHAVADALLGAAGLPDIGNLFPASDEGYKDADSMELLRRVVALVKGEGWKIAWVDAVIEAQVPRLNPYLTAARENLSKILNSGGNEYEYENPDCANICVNIKAKSAERTNDPGAARSMVCRAVATLERNRSKIS